MIKAKYQQIKKFETLKEVNEYLFELQFNKTTVFKSFFVSEQPFGQYCSTAFYVIVDILEVSANKFLPEVTDAHVKASLEKILPSEDFSVVDTVLSEDFLR